jgi:NAD(P)-dependent dehydrogenase (short-subunit alcohol dehydrogenase family)
MMGHRHERAIEGRVVAITGGARGIGLATARALVGEGARVAIADLDGTFAAQAAAELGDETFGIGVDVSDPTAFSAYLDGVEQRLGPLDVLINNAGIFTVSAIEDADPQLTDRILAINLGAVIHGTREAVQRMKPRGTGHIVNMASTGARLAGARLAPYVASKFGVLGFSEAVALELRDTGVDISVILPHQCATDMTAGIERLRGMPLIQPESVADRIVETLRYPRFEVPVPKSIGWMLRLNQVLPFGARAAIFRAIKADEILDRIDNSRRVAYETRLAAVRSAAFQEVFPPEARPFGPRPRDTSQRT